MTDQPAVPPTLPRYGEAALADLASSLLASLRADEPNPLYLPPAARACLLIVDGLGWELLRDHPAAAPSLSELATTTGRPLTAGFPATTVTSLSSLGTGRSPGQHGMLGYQVAVPGQRRLLNALQWDRKVDPVAWQPGSTIFERAVKAGVAAFRVAPGAFRGTGLSVAVMRGAEYRVADSLGALVAQSAAALKESDRALVMTYYGKLDSTGHSCGCTSDAWRYQLGHVDKLAEQLASALPQGTALHVTPDPGMGGVAADGRIDAGATPYVLATWREILATRAWVVRREEAIAAGWFGEVAEHLAARIGDVVAAPAGPWAIGATKADAHGAALVGV